MHNIGHVYVQQYNYNQTIDFYNRALDQLKKINYTLLNNSENLHYTKQDIIKHNIMIKQSLGLAYLTFNKFIDGIKLLSETQEDWHKGLSKCKELMREKYKFNAYCT